MNETGQGHPIDCIAKISKWCINRGFSDSCVMGTVCLWPVQIIAHSNCSKRIRKTKTKKSKKDRRYKATQHTHEHSIQNNSHSLTHLQAHTAAAAAAADACHSRNRAHTMTHTSGRIVASCDSLFGAFFFSFFLSFVCSFFFFSLLTHSSFFVHLPHLIYE